MAEDKQFAPSARRLSKAREKGQVASSRELTAAGTLLLAAVAAPAVFRRISVRLMQAMAEGLATTGPADLTPETVSALAHHWGAVVLTALLPLLVLVSLAAIALSVAQSGPLLTLQPLVPQLSRLNPATAIQRMLSARGLAESTKSLLKLAVIAVTAYLVLRRRGPELLLMAQMDILQSAHLTGRLAAELLLKSAMAMVLVGAADYAYRRYEHIRSLRMTRQEMREETRESEGDPLMRAKRGQRRRELLRDGISRRLPQATVVVTNPTHIAMALYYHAGETDAPVVVARGQGRLAQKIRRLAARYGVPVREDPPVARALYRACPLGQQIPPGLYRAISVIMAEVHRQAVLRRQRMRQQG